MKKLYVGSSGFVVAIEALTGKELWRTTLNTSGGFFSATKHQDVTIVDHEDYVFAGCNGHLYCLKANTGDVLWENDLPDMGFNDVMLSIAGRSTQIVTRTDRR